ncbi:MAG: hypothetical protein GXP17_02405 [Gammaproteobacteria bacterium]|nr:hypothetical protein [Gammaproteobacteria bacterium]
MKNKQPTEPQQTTSQHITTQAQTQLDHRFRQVKNDPGMQKLKTLLLAHRLES